jgi:hypothetical protein
MARPRPFGSPSSEASRQSGDTWTHRTEPLREVVPVRGGGGAYRAEAAWLYRTDVWGGGGGRGFAGVLFAGPPNLEDFLRTVEQRRRLRTEEGVEVAETVIRIEESYFYRCL